MGRKEEVLMKAKMIEREAEVEALRNRYLYTDVTVQFPGGDYAVIQFRNEADRTNLSNVGAGAMSYVLLGAPETPMVYRTEDNVIRTVTAAEMIQIAGYVLQSKQGVVDNAWKHKDAMKQLESLVSLETYDITTGWV